MTEGSQHSSQRMLVESRPECRASANHPLVTGLGETSSPHLSPQSGLIPIGMLGKMVIFKIYLPEGLFFQAN